MCFSSAVGATVPFDDRTGANMLDDIEYLLSSLTLDEKISLIAGKSQWRTADIERLGIPSLKVSQVSENWIFMADQSWVFAHT